MIMKEAAQQAATQLSPKAIQDESYYLRKVIRIYNEIGKSSGVSIKSCQQPMNMPEWEL